MKDFLELIEEDTFLYHCITLASDSHTFGNVMFGCKRVLSPEDFDTLVKLIEPKLTKINKKFLDEAIDAFLKLVHH